MQGFVDPRKTVGDNEENDGLHGNGREQSRPPPKSELPKGSESSFCERNGDHTERQCCEEEHRSAVPDSSFVIASDGGHPTFSLHEESHWHFLG